MKQMFHTSEIYFARVGRSPETRKEYEEAREKSREYWQKQRLIDAIYTINTDNKRVCPKCNLTRSLAEVEKNYCDNCGFKEGA